MANFDVIGAVELTMSAAIMVAGLSVLAGRDAGERLRYSAMLLGWFVIVVILAATGALGNEHGIGAAGTWNRGGCADRVDMGRADASAVAAVGD